MKKDFCRAAWRLFRAYWYSEDKWKARGLLAVVLALNFVAVYLLVLLNKWNNTFYNALQAYDYAVFWQLIGQFAMIAFSYIFVAVYALYLRQLLQLKWRRWMTEQYLSRWLNTQTYHKMKILGDDTDNPDQRISEDIKSFVELTLALSLGFLRQIATLGAFIMILWELSGIITLPFMGGEVRIHGYMLWLSVSYAVLGTWLTAKVGRPLISLDYNQQRYEADFRFRMVRLRENSENVAFYRGEEAEKLGFMQYFGQVIGNYFKLMKANKRLTWFINGYGQAAIIFPVLLAAPRYFSGQMQLGGLMQTISAFGRVQDSLSFFVDSYSSLAQWIAVTRRLLGFVEHMQAVEDIRPDTDISETSGSSLQVDKLTVKLPNGNVLLRELELSVQPGDRLLITGISGCGKSTLMRTLAGIWPYAQGRVAVPARQRRLFLPQRPYLPLGSLREALFYPEKVSERVSDEGVREILRACCLDKLTDKLDIVDDWSRILSLGEQQRIAFARVLLIRPQWAFLDEATSALDEDTENIMYGLLKDRLPGTALLSIGHRSTLIGCHNRFLHLYGDGSYEIR